MIEYMEYIVLLRNRIKICNFIISNNNRIINYIYPVFLNMEMIYYILLSIF